MRFDLPIAGAPLRGHAFKFLQGLAIPHASNKTGDSTDKAMRAKSCIRSTVVRAGLPCHRLNSLQLVLPTRDHNRQRVSDIGFHGPVLAAMHRPWRPAVALILVVFLSGTHRLSAALEFDMLFQTKCVMEEINRGVLVVGDYAAFEKENADRPVEMDVKVRRLGDTAQAESFRLINLIVEQLNVYGRCLMQLQLDARFHAADCRIARPCDRLAPCVLLGWQAILARVHYSCCSVYVHRTGSSSMHGSCTIDGIRRAPQWLACRWKTHSGTCFSTKTGTRPQASLLSPRRKTATSKPASQRRVRSTASLHRDLQPLM